MQSVSEQYKKSMKQPGRRRGYIRATIGVINSKAQENASVDKSKTSVAYFANTEKPFENEPVTKVYATAEEKFAKVDGSMYFLPEVGKNATYYNNGIVTSDLLGSVLIKFSGGVFDLKGLTIDFGECYPVDFTIETENLKRKYAGNASSVWSTEDVFDETTFIKIQPSKMSNGQGRLRIHRIYSGVVNAFSSADILKYSEKEYVSPISDSIPSKDITLVVDNHDQYYNPDNPESALAYMEIGQELKVQFGYDTGDGIEWLPEQVAYLEKWYATDTEAEFNFTDEFYELSEMYYRGTYRDNGISLYDLAVDVFEDAGVPANKYYIDCYLKNVKVNNPMPTVTHAEALQIIANAGRCVLFQDRSGKMHIKSSFVPKMQSKSNDEERFSNAQNLLDDKSKIAYALTDSNFTKVDGTMFFLPESGSFENACYVSKSTWYESEENAAVPRLAFRLGNTTRKSRVQTIGKWHGEEPKITITLENAYTAYGLMINFRENPPKEFAVKTYLEDVPVESRVYENNALVFTTREAFELFDRMEIAFTKGYPNSRVFIDRISIGDVTDYKIGRNDLTSSVTSERKTKVKNISVVRNVYRKSKEPIMDLITEEFDVSEENNIHTIYFTNPSYEFTAEIVNDEESQNARISEKAKIIDQSSYYVTVKVEGVTSPKTVKCLIKGYEYVLNKYHYVKKYNSNGEEIEWDNPLLSERTHAEALENWLATYYLGDVEYDVRWRGDPRVDANDLFYLELKGGSESLIRCYQNELNFAGAWSGSMKTRKAVL